MTTLKVKLAYGFLAPRKLEIQLRIWQAQLQRQALSSQYDKVLTVDLDKNKNIGGHFKQQYLTPN